MDPGAGAPSIKHDPVKNPTVTISVGDLQHVMGLRCRMHDFGHRVESLWDSVDNFGRRVEHLWHLGVGRVAGLRDFGRRVCDVGKEVFCVGGGLPVAEEVWDVAVVAVVGRLGEEAPSQEPQTEDEGLLGHCVQSLGCRGEDLWMLETRGAAGKTQSGCDAHSGLSPHLITVYKDIRAWHGATSGAAIHQSCAGTSQLHQESPTLPLPESRAEDSTCLPSCISLFFFFFYMKHYCWLHFLLLILTDCTEAKENRHMKAEGVSQGVKN